MKGQKKGDLMRTQRNPLARLNQAAEAAEAALAVRAAARSLDRQVLLRAWRAKEKTEDCLSGDEQDLYLAASAEESIYQYELKHGPLTALPLSEEDAPMTPEEMAALSQATVLGICKGAIASGWKPDWKARAEWLTAQEAGEEQGIGKEQGTGERQ